MTGFDDPTRTGLVPEDEAVPACDQSVAPHERTLGKYELLRRLAVGGMAEIFLARSRGIEGFEKLVVLKRILPHFALDHSFVRMFLQEARLAASLQHSNIAQVYDIGQVDRTYFFTMEYVHGVDARRILSLSRRKELRIPLEHALNIVIHTAAALHYAHEKRGPDGRPLGIVHRDVSPSNVLVGYDGGVKLADFGIAKAGFQRNNTEAGTIRGKVAYMSPEQTRAEPLDRRSDVFALGILLFELTTGARLFDGPNDLAVLRQVADQDPATPSSRVADYPPELERIVMSALQRDVSARCPTAQLLQLELERFAHRHNLLVSQNALAEYIGELFIEELRKWTLAQQAGQSLAEFMTATHELPPELAARSKPGAEVPTKSLSSRHLRGLRARRVTRIAVGLGLALVGLGIGVQQVLRPSEEPTSPPPAREERATEAVRAAVPPQTVPAPPAPAVPSPAPPAPAVPPPEVAAKRPPEPATSKHSTVAPPSLVPEEEPPVQLAREAAPAPVAAAPAPAVQESLPEPSTAEPEPAAAPEPVRRPPPVAAEEMDPDTPFGR